MNKQYLPLLLIPLSLPFVSRGYLKLETNVTNTVASAYYATLDKVGLQPKPSDATYLRMIDLSAARHNVPKEIAHSVAITESAINPEATSKAGARGVMQVMPFWYKQCGLDNAQDLYNAKKNIDCGNRILAMNLADSGNAADALCLYNSGKLCSKNSPQETKDYLVKILKNFPLS